MAQQTSMEWFIEQLPIRIINMYQEEINKAKQMEREQIIKAVDSNFNYDSNGYPTLGEQYYNETYGK